jgi:hypothetical protein
MHAANRTGPRCRIGGLIRGAYANALVEGVVDSFKTQVFEGSRGGPPQSSSRYSSTTCTPSTTFVCTRASATA